MLKRFTLPLLLLNAASAYGGLVFSPSPVLESGPPGGLPNALCNNGSVSCLIFNGTIGNPDQVTYNLLDIDLDFGPANSWLTNGSCQTDSTVCGNLFFTLEGPPLVFLPGDPDYTGPIFEVDIDPAIPLGDYIGTVTLLGNSTEGSFDENPLHDAVPLEVDIVAPEPAMYGPLLLGLAGMLLTRLRARPRVTIEK